MTATHRPTALITGAAKRLGAAIATHLAAQGYDIVLHYHRSHAEAEALATKLRAEHGVTVTRCQADLSHPETLGHFWDGLPPCDLLILSAATYERDTLDTMQAATLTRQLAVNFEAPLLLAQGFMTQLPPDIPGNIILLSDGAAGWSLSPHFFSYAVSKQAWVGVIDLLAAAVAPRARANLLALPPVLPGVHEDDAMFARLAQRAPLKRNGTPDELCTAIDFLRQAVGVTGQSISLAGGLNLATARPGG